MTVESEFADAAARRRRHPSTCGQDLPTHGRSSATRDPAPFASTVASKRRGPRRRQVPFAVVAAVAAVFVRLLLLSAPARPDEAGYLLVAQHARRGGAFLYGDLWVDRPPLLIAFFRVADALGGLVAVRLLALVPVVLLIVAAGHAGSTLGGPRGGRWAAAVAAALSVSPLLSAPEVDGELLAAPLVMLGCALGLRALCQREPAGPLTVPSLVLAGAVAGSAVFVKQNFADGLVLLAITVAVQVLRRERTLRRGAVLMGALGIGGALPVVAAVIWSAWWGPGPSELWDVLVAFRAASLDVIATQGGAAPVGRARVLAVIALVSGLVPLLGVFVVARARSLSPIAAGVVGMTGFAALSIALGGSFWPHYLLQLIPAAALAAGLLAPAAGGLRR